MKKSKLVKLIALTLALVLALAAFAACGKKDDGATTAPAGENKTDEAGANETEANPENTSKGKLVMGTNAAFPPYEFIGSDGSIEGIDAEIAKAIADKLGYELEIKDMEFKSLIPAVAAGSIDFALAGMTVNEERLQSVNFSETYATGVQAIIVPENSEIASVDDLDGKKIGVQSGTTGDIYATDDYGQDNVNQYENGTLAVQALLNGQVDCVIIDNEPAKAFVEMADGLKILDTEYTVEDYAAAIAKENTQLLEEFNGALNELKADGTIDAIIAKYISAE